MITWKEPITEPESVKYYNTVWYSADGKYRITWRDKFMDVTITPKFMACVQVEINDHMIWDLISRHNKLGPAQKACAHHASQQKKLQKNEPKKLRKHRVKRGSILGGNQ